jgi:hypothetical protein
MIIVVKIISKKRKDKWDLEIYSDQKEVDQTNKNNKIVINN